MAILDLCDIEKNQFCLRRMLSHMMFQQL